MTAVTDPILNTLGLARRSGSLAIGEEPVDEACKNRKAKVVFLAADAAENTVRRTERLTAENNTPLVILPRDKSELGFALGRSTCALAAVTDAGLAASVLRRLAQSDPERYGQAAAALEEKAQRVQRRKRAKALEKKQAQAGRKPGAAAKPSKHN